MTATDNYAAEATIIFSLSGKLPAKADQEK